MATPNCSGLKVAAHPQPGTAEAVAAAPGRFGRFQPNLASVIDGLMERAEANLSDEELSRLEMFADAESQAGQLAALCEGIGCLVAADGDSELRTGTFQSEDSCSQLLFAIASAANGIRAMARLSEKIADFRIRRQQAENYGAKAAAKGGEA